MHVDDLDHKELLELDPEGGLIRFAGQRAVLLDAVAMGLLRSYLVDNFGLTAARTVLTQFGFAHGWRMAEAMQTEFKWATPDEWRHAGTRIPALEGLFRAVPGAGEDPLSEHGALILGSYEAEQHVLHFGRADAPICWTICGLISGYISRTTGKDIYVLEDRCVGKGDAACHLFGRTREEWGQARAAEIGYFEPKRLEGCLEVSLQRVTESLKTAERKLREHRRALTRVVFEPVEELGVVTKSPVMRKLIDLACRVATVDSTVLITGESGVGKERIARLVHEQSTRAAGPFVAVNCGAITETLLESELFGHARGAFTGANQDRPGLFEAANRGTLLLDEVGEVSPGMQVKLLRAIQEREIRRVGENKGRRIDVRIIAATNRDLALGVAGGAFRQDLYYRLKVVELHVPPLRERRDDILPLARVLLASAAKLMKRKIAGISTSAADQLLRYSWPGNVRELENTMERAAALAQGNRVELEDLPEEIREAFSMPVATTGAVRSLDEVEKEYIIAALELNGGNQTRTAEQLKIGSATLYRKLKSYGLIGAERSKTRKDS
ncbi:sigma-54-dependent Fis family transcriptional regulator [Geothrix fuzhouensis]|uniref:sigma-54-dependent Fis family transcriptional regulator n=1 Tax=Geothrix fuzhouensis TaxID=2966451 RepID=UPI00214871F6|nr:sigma-54-dependent Fis family transcriptional regulator [Geothrix fuzhouensis]